MSDLKLGIVGCDTSHVLVFSDTFNNPQSKQGLKGAKVVAAWPGGSPDIGSSVSRVPEYVKELRDTFGVKIAGSIEEVVAASDAILLTSLDGRVHRAQFDRIAPAGKPVFIDKPFAVNSEDAKATFAAAKRHGCRVFSSSSLRFTEALVKVLPTRPPMNAPERRVYDEATRVLGADFCGPAVHEATNPGFYWYGIHAVEMLYTAMGRGCRSVRCASIEKHDLATGIWADGRIGTVRGCRTGNNDFHGLVHFAGKSAAVNVQEQSKGFFTSLAEAIIPFFNGGPVPVEPEETIELIRFIEAANESAAKGGAEVAL